MSDFGRILFGVTFAVLGALCLGFHDFALMFIPKLFAWRDVPAIVVGVLLLAGGLGLLVPQTARPSALTSLAALLLVRFLFQMRFVVAEPLVEVHYEVIGETLAEIGGALTMFALLARDARFARTGQILFGLALLPCGLSHFFYLDQTAPLIPSWIPFHVALSYFTGAAHFAAGIAILVNVLPRLAASSSGHGEPLHASHLGSGGLRRAHEPRQLGRDRRLRRDLGAAWAVAGSFGDRPWSLARR